VMALAQHGSIATVSIPRSVAMLETMMDGRTVMELPDNPAPANEVAKLWDYLAKRLMKSGVPAGGGETAAAPTIAIKTFAGAAAETEDDDEEPADAAPAARLKMPASKPDTPAPELRLVPAAKPDSPAPVVELVAAPSVVPAAAPAPTHSGPNPEA